MTSLDKSRIVDVHISHLRDKIEPDPKRPVYLVTVRGFGYRFSGAKNDEKKRLRIEYFFVAAVMLFIICRKYCGDQFFSFKKKWLLSKKPI